MRNISSAVIQSMLSSNTDNVFYGLITLEHSSLSEPIRLYSAEEWENGEPRIITSRGNQFIACPIEIFLPEEGGDTTPQVQMRIGNADRAITDFFRSINSSIFVKLEFVTAYDLDSVEVGPFDMKLVNITYDATVVEGILISDQIMNEGYPSGSFDPTNFPGMF